MSSSKILIEASADEVRKVLFDIANYPEWSRSIKATKVESSDDQGRPLRAARARRRRRHGRQRKHRPSAKPPAIPREVLPRTATRPRPDPTRQRPPPPPAL
mgnify:CR=1 FL=1